jgi:hypothetical protein
LPAPAIAVSILIVLINWWRRALRPTDRSSSIEELEKAADWLARTTLARWSAEAANRGLSAGPIVRVTWRLNKYLTSTSAAEILELRSRKAGRPETSGDLSRLFMQLYSQLDQETLYILGPGGYGKTGAMITLLLEALRHRQAEAAQDRIRIPVPVWLNLSKWSVTKRSVG